MQDITQTKECRVGTDERKLPFTFELNCILFRFQNVLNKRKSQESIFRKD